MRLCSKFILTSVLLVLSSCVLTPGAGTHKKITAAGINSRTVYVHSGQLADDMNSMMQGVTNLITLETDESISDTRRHVRIMRELKMLENAAKVIKDGTEISGYTTTNPYMGAFLHDIQMAKEFACFTPPDYQPAASLIKSCVHCHQLRE